MEKQEIINEWLEIINKSWTWPLLTEEEQKVFINYLFCKDYIPYGNQSHVWKCLNNYYTFYLKGIQAIDKTRFNT